MFSSDQCILYVCLLVLVIVHVMRFRCLTLKLWLCCGGSRLPLAGAHALAAEVAAEHDHTLPVCIIILRLIVSMIMIMSIIMIHMLIITI